MSRPWRKTFGQASAVCRTIVFTRPSRTSASNAVAASAVRMSERGSTGVFDGSSSGTSLAPSCRRTSRLRRSICRHSAARAFSSSVFAFFPRSSSKSSSTKPIVRSVRLRRDGHANGRPTEYASSASVPSIAEKTRAQSSADRAIGPTLSIVQESAITPCRLTRPNVGRRPGDAAARAGRDDAPPASRSRARSRRARRRSPTPSRPTSRSSPGRASTGSSSSRRTRRRPTPARRPPSWRRGRRRPPRAAR